MNLIKNIIRSITLVLTFIAFSNVALAAGYTVSLSSNSVVRGNNATLYIKCSDAIGGFAVTSSNTGVASVSGDGRVWCENQTQSITLSTTTTGSSTITIRPLSVSDNNGNDLSLETKTLTLTVTEPVVVKKSSDANLSSLEVEGVTISPDFSKDTLEYTVELPAETTKINIKASTNDGKASVRGTGEVEVSDGSNKIEIVVTAEDGTTKTYSLVANVKELNPITVTSDKKELSVIRKKSDLPEVEFFEESTVKIGEEDVVAYYNEKLDIYLVGLKDSDGNINLYIYNSKDNTYTLYNQITVGSTTLYLKKGKLPNNNYKKYTENINDIDVTIYKLKKNSKVGLIYGVNIITGNEGYYVYDKEEASLQRYYNDEIDIYKDKASNYFTYLMISIGIIALIFILLLIKLIIKKNKKKSRHKDHN